MDCIKIRHDCKNKGQAMIEFVLGLSIVGSFFMFFVKMSAVLAVGNYIHYATFMAARAYMSAGQSKEEQKDRATSVLKAMVSNKFKPLIKPKGGDGSIPGAMVGDGPWYTEDPVHDYWNQGVTYSFESKLSFYPWGNETQTVPIKLTSESWMPREDSKEDNESTKSRILKSIAAAGLGNVTLEFDNGD